MKVREKTPTAKTIFLESFFKELMMIFVLSDSGVKRKSINFKNMSFFFSVSRMIREMNINNSNKQTNKQAKNTVWYFFFPARREKQHWRSAGELADFPKEEWVCTDFLITISANFENQSLRYTKPCLGLILMQFFRLLRTAYFPSHRRHTREHTDRAIFCFISTDIM